jgi:Holliday junction DNA helicase RuvA
MYEYIKGKLISKKQDHVVIDNNGIGYKIFTSLNSMTKMQPDDDVMMHTYLHVREDIMQIFGFAEEEELFLFNLLISISGIGPKAALSILSVMTPSEVALSVVSDDAVALSKAPGVGKKTAMRVILELKDKLKGMAISEKPSVSEHISKDDKYDEVTNALLVLGYQPKYAQEALDHVYDMNDTLQNNIRKALNYLKK